jgi:GNAT superfamily N-acetyltransferase
MCSLLVSLPVGINYEGGKISEYAEKSTFCLGYINAQIAMDAPFHDQIANEAVRALGRSEKSMAGYCEERLLVGLDKILALLNNYLALSSKGDSSKPKSKLLIIQIARGRSAVETIQLILLLLTKHGIQRFHIATGYKTFDYFAYPQEEFYFLNIGMFGRLSHIEDILPGQICNPVVTYDLSESSNQTTSINDATFTTTATAADDPFIAGDDKQQTKVFLRTCTSLSRSHTSSKNLLIRANSRSTSGTDLDSSGIQFKDIILLGIDDHMPFVTPEHYCERNIAEIVTQVQTVGVDVYTKCSSIICLPHQVLDMYMIFISRMDDSTLVKSEIPEISKELKSWIDENFWEHTTGSLGLSVNDKKENTFVIFELYSSVNSKQRVGCIVGQLVFGQMYLKYLMVTQSERGKGLGTQLITCLEREAVDRGCSFIYVESLSFQAPNFYQKCGFSVDFIRKGFDREICYYYLSKHLNVKDL